MRSFRLVIALLAGGAAGASAQLAVQQPTQKLLIMPLFAGSADSAAAIAIRDVVRERITQLAKYKVLVIPKQKYCEALTASGFPCDVLLDDQQARQLARFLQVNAYLTGTLDHSNSLVARVRVFDIGGSGMAAAYNVTGATSSTPQTVAESIAVRLNTVVRVGEQVHDCTDYRQKGQFPRALSSARKALTIDPNSTGAWLCIATVYEAQRMGTDSIIAASQRALAGDSCNTTAWENIARGYQQKDDTLKALDAFITQLCGEPRNIPKRLAIAQQLRQMKMWTKAVQVIDDGLKIVPHDAQMMDLKKKICIEGELWRCTLDIINDEIAQDSSKLNDSVQVKTAIAAGEHVADTAALLRYGRAGRQRFPKSIYFLNKLGAAFEMAGMSDSAVSVYKQSLAIDSTNLGVTLLVAKAIVDGAVWDTTAFRGADSVGKARMREAFATTLSPARPYIDRVLVTGDSTQKLNAAVILLTGGSKLGQAGAYDPAYDWLDKLLTSIPPRTPGDTLGPRQQIRINASFWWGLSSVLTFAKPYKDMSQVKGSTAVKCAAARDVFGRLTRTRSALELGRRVHPPTVNQMLGFVSQYERAKAQVQAAFKCSPPLN